MAQATLVLAILAILFCLLSFTLHRWLRSDFERFQENIWSSVMLELSKKQDRPDIPVAKTYRTYRQDEIVHIVDPDTKSCIICDETEEWILQRLRS